jgi:hypothetical protein
MWLDIIEAAASAASLLWGRERGLDGESPRDQLRRNFHD